MPRPLLPPSDDPKVQARREKARADAQKKRDAVKQTKTTAGSTIAGAIKRKLAVKSVDDSKAKATAGSTIAGAIKRKLTPAPVKTAPNPAGGMTKPKKPKAPKASKVLAPNPAKKEDTNRLHNLPEDLQKKIMKIARPPIWDKDGMSINSHTMDVKDFDLDWFISYMTKKEDPSGDFFYEWVDGVIREDFAKDGKVAYKWTDEEHIKDIFLKKKLIKAKKRAEKDKMDFNENSRVVMFFLKNETEEQHLVAYISNINDKDDKLYKATYGTL